MKVAELGNKLINTRSWSGILDKLGVFASTVCAVHCILSGFFMGLLSVLGATGFASSRVELGFLFSALILGLWAAISGFRKHHSWLPGSLFSFGMGMILWRTIVIDQHSLACMFEAHHHIHNPTPLSVSASVIGGTALVMFHIINIKLIHAKTCTHGCLH